MGKEIADFCLWACALMLERLCDFGSQKLTVVIRAPAVTRLKSVCSFLCCWDGSSRSGSRPQTFLGDPFVVSYSKKMPAGALCSSAFRPNLTEELVEEASEILSHNGVKAS